MGSFWIILISAAVFFSIALWFAVDSEHISKWTDISFFVAIVGGLAIYGCINALTYTDQPMSAVLRTVVDLGKMFGETEAEDYERFVTVIGTNPVLVLLYWLIHFFAYYALVSAIILFIGKDMLRRLRLFLLRIHDVEIIYGINSQTLTIGSELIKKGKASVVFVGDGSEYDAEIRKIGGIWFSDSDAKTPTAKFLKKLSVKAGKGKIRVSALSDNEDMNFDYAMKMMHVLETKKISPMQTELVILGREDLENRRLQAAEGKYGYGSAYIFYESELSARILLRKYPVCDTISFDSKGKAKKDVNVLLIGFGHVGQELLKRIVANGQFEGSRFHACIFDKAAHEKDGFFRSRYSEMLKKYDIRFEPYDGRSVQLTDYVKKNADAITSIYIAVGNESVGREMAYGIHEIIEKTGSYAPIFQCCIDKSIVYKSDMQREITKTFETDIIYGRSLDKLAMEINHYYRGEGESAQKQWNDCVYFDMMSCRASADYLSGLLSRIGITGPESMDSETLENLAKSEHQRWCAFHYSMGYRCMSADTIKEREMAYQLDNSVRITKDNDKKLHACLIPWDELDALSSYENSVTGKHIDYKQMDRDNIVTMVNLICQ